MASMRDYAKMEKDCQSVHKKSSIVSQAWKSVRRHFPNSSFTTDADFQYDIIVVSPIKNVDLIVELCFENSSLKNSWKISVKSSTLSDTFVNQFEKVLDVVCNRLKDWHFLGDEIENILQYVVVRKRNSSKKKETCVEAIPKQCLLNDFEGKDTLKVENVIETVEFNCDIISHYFPEEEKAPRPNYFIAICIHDENIIKSISLLQQDLACKEPLLTKGIIPTEALHLTLCNLGLDSADDLLKAIIAMNQMKCELEKVLPKTSFCVQGTSQFYNRAIYAGVKVDNHFLEFRDLIRKKLADAGVQFREDHEGFTPHVTIIKVRRPERRAFGTRNIEQSLYANFVDVVHGEQTIDAVYLCAMGGQKREDGFYVTACELQFTLNS